MTISKRTLTLVFLAIGLAGLGLLVYKFGVQKLVDQLVAFAPAFPLVLAVEAASNGFSVCGWYYSFTPSARPGLLALQGINFASLPLSGALPSGQAGEVLKANLLRGYAPGSEIVSSLLVYNYLHVATTSLVMAAAPVLALVLGGFATEVALVLLVVSVAIFGVTVGLAVLLHVGLFERALVLLRRLPLRFLRSDTLRERAQELDRRLGSAWRERRGDMWRASLFLVVGRLVQVLEVYVILYFLDGPPPLTHVAMAYAGTALANYLLMALPAREGFQEGSSALVFDLMGLAAGQGFALEVIRRLRKIAFQIFGLGLLLVLLRRGGERGAATQTPR